MESTINIANEDAVKVEDKKALTTDDQRSPHEFLQSLYHGQSSSNQKLTPPQDGSSSYLSLHS